MKKIMCLAMALLLVCSFAGCSGSTNDEYSNEAMAIGKEESDVFAIETEYCTLKYPTEWKEKVTIAVEDHAVTFSEKATNTPIFDIRFGGEDGYVLGVLTVNGEAVEVSVVTYDFADDAANFDELVAMQDDINVIINHLHADYDFELSA